MNITFYKNRVASALKIIAIMIYISGLILGIIIGIDSSSYLPTFKFLTAIIYWISAFILGTIFLGIAEIIRLLQKQTNISYFISQEIVRIELSQKGNSADLNSTKNNEIPLRKESHYSSKKGFDLEKWKKDNI